SPRSLGFGRMGRPGERARDNKANGSFEIAERVAIRLFQLKPTRGEGDRAREFDRRQAAFQLEPVRGGDALDGRHDQVEFFGREALMKIASLALTLRHEL